MPAFRYQGALLDRFGTSGVLNIALGCYALRLLARSRPAAAALRKPSRLSLPRRRRTIGGLPASPPPLPAATPP